MIKMKYLNDNSKIIKKINIDLLIKIITIK